MWPPVEKATTHTNDADSRRFVHDPETVTVRQVGGGLHFGYYPTSARRHEEIRSAATQCQA